MNTPVRERQAGWRSCYVSPKIRCSTRLGRLRRQPALQKFNDVEASGARFFCVTAFLLCSANISAQGFETFESPGRAGCFASIPSGSPCFCAGVLMRVTAANFPLARVSRAQRMEQQLVTDSWLLVSTEVFECSKLAASRPCW
jgi:hypothetical protein